MKKLFAILLTITLLAFAPALVVSAQGYDVEVKEENNLALNKYDWNTDGVGSAKVTFSDGMKLENFNKGGSNFALYKTNTLKEFKLSMYANLSLSIPSEKGYDGYEFDYSNIYISFLIKTDTPSPSYTCPWNGSKAYFSLCFENLQNHNIVNLYLNECWNGSGETRNVVATTRDVNFYDGKYHWYELEVRNDVDDKNRTGKRISFYFDGEEVLTHFQKDGRTYTKSKEDYMDVSFTNFAGYMGFWTNSDFPVGADSKDTDCFVDIGKLKITSYDGGEETVFKKAPAPDFKLISVSYSPAASYETGEEIEIKLSELFSYEGEEELSYEVKCEGKTIGQIRNGYWVWTPENGGSYDIDIKATVGTKQAMNYITIHVVDAKSPASEEPKGCKSSLGIEAVAVMILLSAALLFSNKQAL